MAEDEQTSGIYTMCFAWPSDPDPDKAQAELNGIAKRMATAFLEAEDDLPSGIQLVEPEDPFLLQALDMTREMIAKFHQARNSRIARNN